MEGLISIIILFAVSSILSSAKKKQQQANAMARHQAAAARMQAAAPQPKPAHPPLQMQTVTPPVSFEGVAAPAIAPTVHTHLEPDCETHDAPGSLGFVSTEGKDPCHEEQLADLRTAKKPAAEAQAGLTFDWTGDNIVKAVVMQEVLTRPVQRRAR